MSFAPRSRTPGEASEDRMISANLTSAVAMIERRLRLSAALRVAVPAGAAAAFAWVALRFLAAGALVPMSLLLPAAFGLAAAVLVAAAARGLLVAIPRDAAVRELDRRAGAHGRLIAAHELAQSKDPFARAAVADASPAIVDACTRARTLFPLAVPAQTARAATMLALAPAAALALSGVTISIPGFSRDATAGDPLATETRRVPLPTLAWVMEETKSLLAPLALPQPTPVPVAIATPAPVPRRGSTITDPQKRAWFDKVLEGATPETVGKEIVETFTKDLLSREYETLVAEFKTRGTESGQRYEAGGEKNDFSRSLPKEMMGGKAGGGGMGLPFDPSRLKSDYLKDEADMQSELLSALKETFDVYLKEFAAEMLKGMEEALEKALSEPGDGGSRNVSSRHLQGLPTAPGGLSEGHEPGPGPGEGPMYAMKDPAGGTPSAEAAANGQQALGGTAAGGTGAGAGDEQGGQTQSATGSGRAEGERVDLGGTLDERLAVVEVVRRMSGGTSEIDDTAAAEVVRKSTKAAEAEAAVAEEIPEEYRGAVKAYFEALTAENRVRTGVTP